ncbi:RIP metalloprotease RseP [Periweissella cryptocerci]|uniref:Zinc metalloprotease n=1 Tax=Periweissella cryptocerci TaxID=2506420 RepID=A0A4P6YRP3_9LACO|nr:RIP metalloprotease RseP [Periweissella cryptocerci]QBO35272.1 RIP metalloprotease RseP [Periweissella cryptocerci]
MHNTLLTIITFIVVFGILVIVHEFGHFYFAKKSGILVREFSIGMGPKLIAFRKNHTSYTLRLLPVGGYVRMAGAQEDDGDALQAGVMVNIQLNENLVTRINASQKQTLFQGVPFQIVNFDLTDGLWLEGYENGDESALKRLNVDHDATIIEHDGTEVQIAPRDVQFQSAKLWQRALVNFAGPMNNFILAIVVFAIIGLMQTGGIPSNSTKIGTVMENSVAQKAGLQKGDEITKINGKVVKDWSALSTTLQSDPGKQVTLTYKHGTTTNTIKVTPKVITTQGQKVGQIGITAAVDKSIGGRLMYGLTGTWTMVTNIWHALANLFTGGFNLNKLGGPVAIFANTEQAAKMGLASTLFFMAFLSVNLGIVNLLPIPALDGGKLLLNVLEAIRRKPLPESAENAVQIAGFLFLILLMIAVTFNDVYRYFIK